jgi:hypothetical protein
MSSRDLSRVIELSCKAFELQQKGHFARGVEKGAAAIAAAQELAQEDCLVVTFLQLLHAVTLLAYGRTPGVAADAASAAKEQSQQTLLAAMATLERRRAAGTLLAGTCRSWPEEEWYGHFTQHRAALNKDVAYTPVQLALYVQFLGYDAYLYAAATVCNRWACGLLSVSSDFLLFARCALQAIDLFEQPRLKIGEDFALASERSLTATMRPISETHSQAPIGEGDIAPLLTRWQDFARSGVLEERGLIADAVHSEGLLSARQAAKEARLAAATLKCCSLQSCASRELHPGHYKRCSACHITVYCCREHQQEDWRAHKPACKAARKAAAAEGGGAA